MAVERPACSVTCTLDGLAHLVSDEATIAGIAARRGIYTALCGHQVHAAAMICPAGRSCPRCAQQIEEYVTAAAEVVRSATRRGGWHTWLQQLTGLWRADPAGRCRKPG